MIDASKLSGESKINSPVILRRMNQSSVMSIRICGNKKQMADMHAATISPIISLCFLFLSVIIFILAQRHDEPCGCLARRLRSSIRDKQSHWLHLLVGLIFLF
jgi:hypothetical protein